MQALVLSGGETRGRWQAGAVRYLGEVQPSGFHVTTGTSVGALIAAGLAMFPPERFSEVAQLVEHIWRDRIGPLDVAAAVPCRPARAVPALAWDPRRHGGPGA